MSPASKAQQKAVAKYMKNNYDEMKIRIPKGEKAEIQAHAEEMGESVNAFMYRAALLTVHSDGSSPSQVMSGSNDPVTAKSLREEKTRRKEHSKNLRDNSTDAKE